MVFVMRHGQTDWNKEKRTQGSIETNLNEEGKAQAQRAREELIKERIDVVLCSPRKRCIETAKIVCKDRDIPKIIVPELGERIYGKFEGKQKDVDYDWNELWDWELNKTYETVENVRTFYKRIIDVLEKVKEEYAGKNVLIVTHSGVSAMIYCYANNLKPHPKLKSEIKGVKNCEIVKYDLN